MPTRRPVAELTVFTPLLSPERHELPEEPVSIGRAPECVIPVRDRYLSRKHAELIPLEYDRWLLRDCGSANGTWVNGSRVTEDQVLRSGDRIRLGDTELIFHLEVPTDRVLAIAESRISATISIPIDQIEAEDEAGEGVEVSRKTLERLRVLNSLAAELIEDRPMNELFGFIVDRVMEHLEPSRAAIGLLADNGTSFASVEVRRSDHGDDSDLRISRTLLAELVEEKKALAFVDVSADEKLSQAKSIVTQGIHSVLCAPIMLGGAVAGVLYVDYFFTQKSISEDDVRLVAQVARFAAMKLENTRLREESLQKRLMDEELRTAYAIQKGLLPDTPPVTPGFTFEARNRPCRTVSGDYYDFVERPDGTIYFVIADVSGKGITAALIMAGLQASFRIFTRSDPSPAGLIDQLNTVLKESIPRSRFVTLFAGRVNTFNGEVEYANAGHTPPMRIRNGIAEELGETDLILGMFTSASYRNQKLTLERGESLLMFTDGISEAEDASGELFGTTRLYELHPLIHGRSAAEIAGIVEQAVLEFSGDHPLEDDFTLVVITRDFESSRKPAAVEMADTTLIR